IISEIGVDMSRFATVHHFCSWLGLCPLVKKTGGRVRSSGTRPGVNRAAVAFRLAAHSPHASQGAIGAFLRRKKAHLGAPKAITSAADKLAGILYLAMKEGRTYVRQTRAEYEARVREQQVKALHKQPRALGLEVSETPTPQRCHAPERGHNRQQALGIG